jgi:hypothetical protein
MAVRHVPLAAAVSIPTIAAEIEPKEKPIILLSSHTARRLAPKLTTTLKGTNHHSFFNIAFSFC